MSRNMLGIAIGTVSGILIGGFLGYVVTERVLRAKYELMMDEEAAAIKSYYQDQDSDTTEDPEEETHEYSREEIEELPEEELEVLREDLQRDLIEKGKNSRIIRELGYSEPSPAEVRPEQEDRKMTVEEAEEIDPNDELLEEMKLARTNSEPFIITIDEFMEENPEYEKITVTYFDGDGTLCDSQEKIIPEIRTSVGDDALTKFGLFSKDKSIVYVRNERLKVDFEVVLDERSYTEAIAGFRDQKVLRKMREDD